MKQKKRIAYLAATILLLVIEVLIALFIRDSFIRPYVGDALVVILLYTCARILLPEKIKLLPLYVFLFAACVEGLQAINIVRILGLENSSFFSILLGMTFDIKDIICYGVGCVITGTYEYLIWKKERNYFPDV